MSKLIVIVVAGMFNSLICLDLGVKGLCVMAVCVGTHLVIYISFMMILLSG